MQHRVVGWGIAAIVGMFMIPALFGAIFARGSAFDDLRGSIEGECAYSDATGIYVLNANRQATAIATITATADLIDLTAVRVAAPGTYGFNVPVGSQSRQITNAELNQLGIAFDASPVPTSIPRANHVGYGYVINGVIHPVAFNQQPAPFTTPTNANYNTYGPFVECQPVVSGTPRADVAQPANVATVVANGNAYAAIDYSRPSITNNAFQPIIVVMISFVPLLLIAAGVVYLWSNRRASGARR